MKCFSCQLKNSKVCQKCNKNIQSNKSRQLQDLNNSIQKKKNDLQKLKALQFIEVKGNNQENKSVLQYIKNSQFSFEIQELIKKQNIYARIKKLKQRIKEKQQKTNELKQKNQKTAKLIQNQQEYVRQTNNIISKLEKEAPFHLDSTISLLIPKLKQLDSSCNIYLKLIYDHTLLMINNIHSSIINKTKKNFNIEKLEELEELDCYHFGSSQSKYESENHEQIHNSIDIHSPIYQLEKLQQVCIKQKINEKQLHIIIINLIILSLLVKIFNIWLPYHLVRKINFNQSQLQTVIDSIKIGGKNLIDFSNTTDITPNITQFFQSQIKTDEKLRQKINEKTQNKYDEEEFQNIQFDNQNAQYNRKTIELNKAFIHYLQTNLEYLSSKHRISNRPLIFCQKSLILNIINQNFERYRIKDQLNKESLKNPNPTPQKQLQFSQNYDSMLRQVKLHSALEAFQKSNQFTSQKSEQFLLFGKSKKWDDIISKNFFQQKSSKQYNMQQIQSTQQLSCFADLMDESFQFFNCQQKTEK